MKLLAGIVVGIVEIVTACTSYAQQVSNTPLKFNQQPVSQKNTQAYSLERMIEQEVQKLDPAFADIVNTNYTSDVMDRPVSFVRYRADETDNTDASFEDSSYRIFLRMDRIQRTVEAIPHELWHAYAHLRKDGFLGPRHTYPSHQEIVTQCTELLGSKRYEKLREENTKSVMEISLFNKELYCLNSGINTVKLSHLLYEQVKQYLMRHNSISVTTIIDGDKEYTLTAEIRKNSQQSLDSWASSLEKQLDISRLTEQSFRIWQKDLDLQKYRSFNQLLEKLIAVDRYFRRFASTIGLLKDIVKYRDAVYRCLDTQEDKAHQKLRQFYCRLLSKVAPNQRREIGRLLIHEDHLYSETLRFRQRRSSDQNTKVLVTSLQTNFALTLENHRLQNDDAEEIMNDADEIMPRVVEAIVNLEMQPSQNQYPPSSKMLEFMERFKKAAKPILDRNLQTYRLLQTMVQRGIPQKQARVALRGKLNNFRIKGNIPYLR